MTQLFSEHCKFCGGNAPQNGAKYFCSRECYYSSRRGKPYRPEYKIRTCINCEKEYSPTNTTGKRCKACSGIRLREIQKQQVFYYREWRKKNPQYNKEYYWKNLEKSKMKCLNRTHLKRANGGAGLTVEEWQAIKKHFDFICQMCRKKEPEIKLTQDHIIPLSKGGKHERTNIQPLCGPCNTSKGNN